MTVGYADRWYAFHSGALVKYKGLVHVVYYNKGALLRFECMPNRTHASRRACIPIDAGHVTCFECVSRSRSWSDHMQLLHYRREADDREAAFLAEDVAL